MPYTFYGGIHPPSQKILTSDVPTKRVFIPKKAVLPLSQHVGSPAEPLVVPGDRVTVGMMIAKAAGFISSPVHATISGTVTKIAPHPSPAAPRAPSIIIESQETDEQEFAGVKRQDAETLSKDELLTIIRDAGIVGLGGAVFPTPVKLSPPKEKPIDSIIINGAECEPYLTCDYRLMIERPGDILKASAIIAKITGAKNIYIAIEDNKLAAIYAMERALSAISRQPSAVSTKIVILKTKYPQGAEKQVIKAVLHRVVPAGGLPMDVGCIVQNVGTAIAIYEAAYRGKPLIERSVTLTGTCIKEPVNVYVRIGTLVSDLVAAFGGFTKKCAKCIIGGPMMGVAQYTLDIPITKGTSGILFLSSNETVPAEESVCIRCGRCIEVCPMGLVPTTLMYAVKKDNFIDAKMRGIAYCYECGSCAYACPAKIPLVDYMKFGKAQCQHL